MNMAYTNKTFEDIKDWLRLNLSEERYIHSLGTMECAYELAKMFCLDEVKAKTAGLLHDCAKCYGNDILLEIINEKIKDVHESELLNYKTLHAPVSAYFAKEKFGVEDEEILSAIRWHTLGHVGMSSCEKMIFIADKIEPNTRPRDYREEIMAVLKEEHGLDKALLRCYTETIKSLVKRRLAICHITIDVYNELLNCLK